MTFNHELYVTSRKGLIENGVPCELASLGAVIVAKDDPNKPNLGRTPEDLEIAHEVVKHLNAFWLKEED